MKALYFTKRGQPGLTYWRCGDCGTDFPNLGSTLGGIRVQIGNQLTALLCGECVPAVARAVAEAAPRSFPDLDEIGNLL